MEGETGLFRGGNGEGRTRLPSLDSAVFLKLRNTEVGASLWRRPGRYHKKNPL